MTDVNEFGRYLDDYIKSSKRFADPEVQRLTAVFSGYYEARLRGECAVRIDMEDDMVTFCSLPRPCEAHGTFDDDGRWVGNGDPQGLYDEDSAAEYVEFHAKDREEGRG